MFFAVDFQRELTRISTGGLRSGYGEIECDSLILPRRHGIFFELYRNLLRNQRVGRPADGKIIGIFSLVPRLLFNVDVMLKEHFHVFSLINVLSASKIGYRNRVFFDVFFSCGYDDLSAFCFTARRIYFEIRSKMCVVPVQCGVLHHLCARISSPNSKLFFFIFLRLTASATADRCGNRSG